MTKKSVELEESEALGELVNKYKEKTGNVDVISGFPGKYNPWKGKNFDELLDDSSEILKDGDRKSSWLKIDKDLYNESEDKRGKATSIDYGIPSHARGDIENGTLFLCLVNLNTDVKIMICEAVGKQDKEDTKKCTFDISSKGGILYKEIVELKEVKGLIGSGESGGDKNKEKNKKGYYTANYLNAIFSVTGDYGNKDEKEYEDLKRAVKVSKRSTHALRSDDKNKSKNDKDIKNEDLKSFIEKLKEIANLEVLPLRGSTLNFVIDGDNAKDRFANCLVDSNPNVGTLSVGIVIQKILEYVISPKDNVRPVFIFRKFNRTRRPSIENVLRKNFFEKDKDNSIKESKAINIATDNITKKSCEESFYTAGSKDQDNTLKMSENIYKNDANIYREYKKGECKGEEYKEKENDRENKKEVFSKLITDTLASQKRQ